ncbi:MAG: hypothetical protein K6G61_03585 [Solobacterium sp.]|nr:hypothetical protein [Solobacterium sp.]
MHILKKFFTVVLAVLLLAACSRKADNTVFIRIDRDDPDAWKEELANVRFLQDEHMSGSAQFSETQFRGLASKLKEQSDSVWIVDCRLESHGLINGIAVSWCGKDNGANLGKTAEEVEEEEKHLSSLIGTKITAYTAENDLPKDGMDFTIETWQTERELTEAAGMNYMRLACPDHCWPPAEVIDSFIGFAKDLDENVWLHFHCQAGSGRTGAFMTIYEMMQKAGAPVEEILRHQADTGSGNLVKRSAPEKSHAQKERCVLARAAYLYICENKASGYDVKWSEWLEAHSQSVTMKIGDKLDGEGFSSDELVVNDSLEALAEGQATVLAGDEVLFITVEK